MNRTAPLLAVFVLLVAGAALPVAGSVADSTGTATRASQAETATPAPNGSAGGTAPGTLFSGVVDVQEAEVESELEGRAFGIKVARANSNESKAAVVAGQVDELQRRTEALRERKQSLTEARENGSISRARYRAEMAALAARSEAVQRQLDRTQSTSNDLPADLLESKGVDPTAIETLRNESRSVVGPDAADIARSISGPGSGDGLDEGNATPGLPGTVPGRAGVPNGSDTPDGPPDTDEFDTPTRPGDDGNGPPTRTDGPPISPGEPPTPSDGPDLPNVSDDVPDVLSPILGGPDGETETDTSTDTETTTDDTTGAGGNESAGSTG